MQSTGSQRPDQITSLPVRCKHAPGWLCLQVKEATVHMRRQFVEAAAAAARTREVRMCSAPLCRARSLG